VEFTKNAPIWLLIDEIISLDPSVYYDCIALGDTLLSYR